jgi:hypothetical protein
MNELSRRLDAILDLLVVEEASIAAATARRAVLLEEATSIRLAQAGHGTEGLAMRSLTAEIACATRTSESTVLRLLNDAETLVRSLPATLHALAEGTIGYRHAQAMASHARVLPDEVRSRFESTLLPEARATTPARFERAARREREAVHPESIDARAMTAAAERSVRFEADADGMAWLTCHLPAVAAVAIDDRLDRIARSARCDTETRTHGQLRADALSALLLGVEALSGPALTDGVESIVPTVIVTVPVLSLLGHDAGTALLQGAGPIDLTTARRLAERAPSFVRILTDPDTGETISVGRHRYRPPADLRLALSLADDTCRFPGCNRSATHCELDHTDDWAHGGATSRANLHHLCPKHHHLKHDNSGWTVRATPDRTLTWTSPTGRPYTTAPAHPPSNGPRPRFTETSDPPPHAPHGPRPRFTKTSDPPPHDAPHIHALHR